MLVALDSQNNDLEFKIKDNGLIENLHNLRMLRLLACHERKSESIRLYMNKIIEVFNKMRFTHREQHDSMQPLTIIMDEMRNTKYVQNYFFSCMFSI